MVRGTTRSPWPAERKWRRVETAETGLIIDTRYRATSWWRHLYTRIQILKSTHCRSRSQWRLSRMVGVIRSHFEMTKRYYAFLQEISMNNNILTWLWNIFVDAHWTIAVSLYRNLSQQQYHSYLLPRDALVHSAVLRLHVVRPSIRLSICDVGGSGSHRLEILETKIHVQTNTKSVQCLCINTKHNKVRITHAYWRSLQGLSGKW